MKRARPQGMLRSPGSACGGGGGCSDKEGKHVGEQGDHLAKVSRRLEVTSVAAAVTRVNNKGSTGGREWCAPFRRQTKEERSGE